MPRKAALLGAIAVVTMAGTALSAGPPAWAARQSPPSITITARSRVPVVSGDVQVEAWPQRLRQAHIGAVVTGSRPGDVVRLLAQPFPYHKRPVAIGRRAVKSGRARYAFSVKPAIATRYQVVLYAPPRTGGVLARSAHKTVYISWGGYYRPQTYPSCVGEQTCRITSRLHIFYPASVARREVFKHWYFYLGVRLAPANEPPLPKWLTLRHRHYTIGKPVRVSRAEYKLTIKFSFRIARQAYRFNWDICTRDTEAKDGFGLPGRHGCGDKRVAWAAVKRYLG